MTAHVFYELAAGVGLPLASWIGPRGAAVLWATSGPVVFRQADRQPATRDTPFALLNGLYLAAVVSHFAGWPSIRRAGVPLLIECEGLSGRLIQPYNVILYASGVAALVALLNENRAGMPWGAFVAATGVPLIVWGQHREFTWLREQAQRCPAWWNRRLVGEV
jgi:hypothetical protein